MIQDNTITTTEDTSQPGWIFSYIREKSKRRRAEKAVHIRTPFKLEAVAKKKFLAVCHYLFGYFTKIRNKQKGKNYEK